MKTSGIPIESLPPHVQQMVRAAENRPVGPAVPASGAKRLRQDSAGLNKTEAAFQDYLKAAFPQRFILAQSLTLKLANGVRYTPDFFIAPVIVPDLREQAQAYEVKGFMRDDAAVKIKVAAALYPWIKFFLVTRRSRTCGGWDIQRILP